MRAERQHLFVFLTSLLNSCLGQSDVHTVVIESSHKLIQWADNGGGASSSDTRVNTIEDYNATATQNTSSITVMFEKDLVSFYEQIYTQTDSLFVFVDMRIESCPIDLFRDRLLGYITQSTIYCPHTRDVTAMATVTVETRSLDLMAFMSEFLFSWNAESRNAHGSFALLFDRSQEEQFLLSHRKSARRVLFEITLPLTNCSQSDHVTRVAAETNINDVVVIATTKCITDLLIAVSKLALPKTRFRWVLYPTDGYSEANSSICVGLEEFCDDIKAVVMTERDRPEDRPVYSREKLLGFVSQGVTDFLATVSTDSGDLDCQPNCTVDCRACQLLFHDKLMELDGQTYEVFYAHDNDQKKLITFDLHRLAPNGNIYLGSWSQVDGLNLTRPAYPLSFIDSQLSVVVIVEPPFIYRNVSENGDVEYYGYSIDVLKEIAARVGFSYTVRECDHHGYGVYNKGVWTGCIGNVVRGEADVILGALTVTAERDTVIDFTLPYYDFAGIQVLMKKQADSIDLFYYANVFTIPAWVCLGAVVVVTSLLLWTFEKITSSKTRKGHYAVNTPLARTSSIPFSTITTSSSNNSSSSSNGVSTTIIGNNNVSSNGNGPHTTELVHHTNGNVPNGNGVKHQGDLEEIYAKRIGVGRERKLKVREKAEEKEGKNPDPQQDTVYNLGESIWFVVGALTMAGGGDPPRSLSGRLLIAGFWFFAVIMMSTFTANLAAFLTVSRMGMTISSLDDLAAQTDITYSVVNQSSVMEYFERMAKIEQDFYERWKAMSLDSSHGHTEDSLAVWDYPLGNKYGAMWSAIKKAGLIESNEAGLNKVKTEKFALITESPLIQFYTGRNCELTGVGDQFSVRPYAIGLKERSLYTGEFSDAILALQKERELGSLRLKWWSDNGVSCPKEAGNAGLDLFSLSGTFIVAGAGVGSGLIVLALEHLFSQVRKRQKAKAEGRVE